MRTSNRASLAKILGPVLLLTAVFALPAAGWAQRADPSVYHIDGYLTDQGYECQTLRDHNGRIYTLVGAIGGLRTGDHVRLMGRRANDRRCRQGTTFEVYEVRTVWADDRHRTTLYDHLYDGRFRGLDRARDDDRYGYDDRYDDDRYDRDGRGNRRAVSVDGRLFRDDRNGCHTLETNGRDYSLVGDIGRFRSGERVRVIGFLEPGTRCPGTTIDVGEITRR